MMRIRLFLLALATAAAALPAVAAGPDTVWFAGSEGSPSARYSYVGMLRPLAGASLGQGLFVRAGVNWLQYRYDATIDGQSRQVRARAPGADVGLGWAFGDAAAGGEVALSVGTRHTRLSPDDPASDAGGTHATASPQLALHMARGAWRAEGLGVLTTGVTGRYARARLGWQAASWQAGPELQWSSGDDYRDRRWGVYTAFDTHNGVVLGLNGGRSRDRDGRHSGYVGLSASGAF